MPRRIALSTNQFNITPHSNLKKRSSNVSPFLSFKEDYSEPGLDKRETFNSKNILIVDDTEYNRAFMKMLLMSLPIIDKKNIGRLEASNGEEAVKIYKEESSAI